MEGFNKKQLFIAAIVYLGELSAGFVIGWSAPVIPKLQSPQQSPLSAVLTDGQASLMGSMMFVGSIIGAQIAGCLSNMKGRKSCFHLGGITNMAAYLLLITSVNLWMLMIARLLHGAGFGIVYITSYAYIAEISSTKNRGILLTCIGITSSLGNFLAYCIGPYVTLIALSYVGLFIAMLYTSGTFFIPETPAFYVMKGREIEAKEILVLLGRSEDIEDVLSSKNSTSWKQEWRSIVSIKSNRKALLIATVLLVCQETSGFACLLYFATSIFQTVKSTINPAFATMIIGATIFIASCITPMFVDRVGRKPLLLVSTAVCFFALIIFGGYCFLETLNPSLASHVHWLPLLSIVTYLLGYMMGFCIIPFTLMSEMFDSMARGPGSSIANTVGAIFGFLTLSSFSYMISTLGNYGTFWIFSLSCALAFVFTAVVVPETKGKSLTEIQYLLNK